MTDSLKIWGTDYTGVKGFKAKDSSNNQYAYLRPQGTKSITENGNNIDVSEYASASVNVDRTGGHVDQQGSSIVIPAEEVDSGYTISQIVSTDGISGSITVTVSTIRRSCFRSCTGITSIIADSVINLGSGNAVSIFQECTNLESIHMANLETIGNSQYFMSGCTKLTAVYLPKLYDTGDYAFQNCSLLTAISLPSASGGYRSFQGCSSLQIVDYGGIRSEAINIGNFQGCGSLKTLVLRNTSVTTLSNTNAFSNSPFASGGTGGTIYIPQSLYDHLGDGTSSDYQSATNWSTIYGYGTITWAKIEGSYYETHYADGTEIPSA